MIKRIIEKSIFSCIIFLLFANMLDAQNRLQYNKYVFPDLFVQGMNLTGNAEYRKANDQNNELSRIELNADLNYFAIENKPDIQRYRHSLISGSYSRISDNNSVPFMKESRTYIRSNYYQEYRKYFNPKKGGMPLYWEIDQLIDIEAFNNDDLNSGSNVFRFIDAEIAFPVKFGVGRIEPLAGLPLAEFLADDLLEAGLIDTLFGQGKIFELAQKIVTVENARVFDSRRARIYRLTEISCWLEKHGVPSGIQSFSILNDNLFFAQTGIRGHGKFHSLGFVPYVAPDLIQIFPLLEYGFGLQYEFRRAKNISKKLHHDWGLKSGYFAISSDIFQTGNVFLLKARYALTYVPITRTILTIVPRFSLYSLENDRGVIETGISANLTYFINHRLSLNSGIQYLSIENSRPFSTVVLPSLIASDFYSSEFYRTNIVRAPAGNSFKNKTTDLFLYATLSYNLF